MLGCIWQFLRDRANLAVITAIGALIAALATGAWAVFTYFDKKKAKARAIAERRDQIEEKVDELRERLDRSGETKWAIEAGLELEAILALVRGQAVREFDRQQTLLELARKHPVEFGRQLGEAIDVVDQMFREFRNQVSIIAALSALGQGVTTEGGFIEGILKRVKEFDIEGDFDGGAKIVDDSLGELKRRDEEWTQSLQISEKTLLEAGVKQDLLRHDPAAVANRIEAIAALEAPGGNPVWSQKYKERFDAFYAEGEEKGINLSLEVAIEMARRMVASAPNGDQHGIALNMLGNALWRLGDRESGTGLLEEAVAAYQNALQDLTRERVPLQWAETQNNLGNALRALGQRASGTARLEDAVSAFREALKERTRARAPLDWAATQSDLGSALWRLGEQERRTDRLEAAVDAFREALKERTRARAPLDWATTQNVLGNALRDLGGLENRTARLEEAVNAYREALKVRTRDRVPLAWATTRNNLGNALRALGELEAGTASLEKAVEAYHDALKELTREGVPLRWAMTQYNLAEVYLAVFNKNTQTRHLDDALDAVDGALEEFRKANAAFYIDKAERQRAQIIALMGQS